MKIITCIISFAFIIIFFYSSRSVEYKNTNKGYNTIVLDPYDASTNNMNELFDDHNVILFRHEGRLILEAWK